MVFIRSVWTIFLLSSGRLTGLSSILTSSLYRAPSPACLTTILKTFSFPMMRFLAPVISTLISLWTGVCWTANTRVPVFETRVMASDRSFPELLFPSLTSTMLLLSEAAMISSPTGDDKPANCLEMVGVFDFIAS
ncbi:Uncharacterised protein [uncultured archaeon]|nr:Uncharacterised protein [uncultured archaeon]